MNSFPIFCGKILVQSFGGAGSFWSGTPNMISLTRYFLDVIPDERPEKNKKTWLLRVYGDEILQRYVGIVIN